MKIMMCRENFWANVDGVAQLFEYGRTMVSDDSDIYLRFPDKFVIAEPHFQRDDVEAATAAPGERRGTSIVGARATTTARGT